MSKALGIFFLWILGTRSRPPPLADLSEAERYRLEHNLDEDYRPKRDRGGILRITAHPRVLGPFFGKIHRKQDNGAHNGRR